MRSQHKVVITAALLCHLFLATQIVTSQARPDQVAQDPATAAEPGNSSQTQAPTEAGPGNCHMVITAAPSQPQNGREGNAQPAGAQKPRIPISEENPVTIDARECEKAGTIYNLRGDISLHFGEYDFHADSATYDSSTADLSAKGNVQIDGGERDIHITASEGTYNTRSHTGKFYNVHGSTGARFKGRSVTLTSSSPLSFSGKVVEQNGPDEYVLYHGSVTSCELPHPKWNFTAA